jgi:hypothetical protein
MKAGAPLEQLAIGDRFGVAAGDAGAVALVEEHAALKLAGHVAESDLGAVRRFVNDLEHGRGPWDVNPWRLVEHLAELLMRRSQPAAEPAEDVPTQAAEVGDVETAPES